MMENFIKKWIDHTAEHDPKLWRKVENAARYVLCRQKPPLLPNTGTVVGPVVDFQREDPAALARRLANYDVISFDVFDTLIFRAFDEPKIIFQLWGLMHDQPYAYNVRCAAERELKDENGGEATLADIYQRMELHLGIPAEQGMEDEIRLEMHYCRPNPYMLEVYNRLRRQGKRIVITSDMYLPKDTIATILSKCGYAGWEALYVSSDCQCTKRSGTMWKYLDVFYPKTLRRIHIGDHPKGDVVRPAEAGWDVCHYQNVHQINGKPWRTEMSRPIGSLWRGLVNEHLYAGGEQHPPLFDLGFVYFGLPVYGYCQYLHEKVKKEKVGLILFGARDMRTVWEVYRERYDTPCEYVPVSRTAMFRADFVGSLENVLTHIAEVAQGSETITVGEFFGGEKQVSLCAPFLLPWLERYGVTRESRICAETFPSIQLALLENREQISTLLEEDRQAAIHFYRELWERYGRPGHILFADLTGRGTCLSALRHIFQAGGIQARVTGTMMYTTAQNSRVCDFLDQSLCVYVFSWLHNAEMMELYEQLKEKKQVHFLLEESVFTDENGLLLSYTDGHGGLLFRESEMDTECVRTIREGIVAFSRKFARYCALPDGQELHIPGRDVFWPLVRGADAYANLTIGKAGASTGGANEHSTVQTKSKNAGIENCSQT